MNKTDKNRYIQIGLKIAYYRKFNELTQNNLSEMAGINPGYLSQIETPNFVQPISLKLLFKFADIFKIPPYKLLEFDDIA